MFLKGERIKYRKVAAIALFVFIQFSFRENPALAETSSEPATKPESSANPTSEGASTIASGEPERNRDLILRLANESNQPDGIFGPFTFGVRGQYSFANRIAIEGGYIRLHEPNSQTTDSFLDEAQLTVKSPESILLGQPIVVAATAWKNRMIDMYTEVLGVELTRTATWSPMLGLYSGSASREELSQRFLGYQFGLTTSFGSGDISLAHFGGRIQAPNSSSGAGAYRKTALSLSTDALRTENIPLSLTANVEDRYFDFGGGGPVSDKRDELIFVLGIEFHLVSK